MYLTKIVKLAYVLTLSLSLVPSFVLQAHAEASTSTSVRVEIASQGAGRHVENFTLTVSENEPGELRVTVPGVRDTSLKLRFDHPHGVTGLNYEVNQIGSDKQSFSVRGQVGLPPPGKRTVVAHIPLAGEAEAEVALTILPPRS
jgi:hypothetical protein